MTIILADYDELKLIDHKPVTQGVTNAGALDPSGTDDTSRDTANRALSMMRRKIEEHLKVKVSCKKGFRMVVLADKRRPYFVPPQIITRLATNQ